MVAPGDSVDRGVNPCTVGDFAAIVPPFLSP